MKKFTIEHSILFISIDQMPEELLGDIDEPYNFMLGSMTTAFKKSKMPLQALDFRPRNQFGYVVTISDLDDMNIGRALQEDIERLRLEPCLPPEELDDHICCRQMIAEMARQNDVDNPSDDALALMPDFVKNARHIYAPPPQSHYKRVYIPASPFAFDNVN